MTLPTLAIIVLGLLAPPDQQPAPAEQQAPPPASIKIGEVIGDEVHLRSGPGVNYYPVARLHKGDHVVIVGHKPAWVGVAPPSSTYSLVAKQYVDLDGQDQGVINGDRVWVRAGTDLSDDKYAKQTQLSKGASITIVGESGEYYKIIPPKGAMLWISADYVRVADENQPTIADQEPVIEATPVAPQATPPPAPSIEGIEIDRLQSHIEHIEQVLEQEFKKDAYERDLQSVVDRFAPLASQDEDVAAKQYAAYRIKQLQRAMNRIESQKKAEELIVRLREQRIQFLEERSRIHPGPVHLAREFAVRGKFVTSAAYSSPVGLQRFRIIDPESKGMIPHTIAYIEIDPQSDIDPQAFVGRYVGVRARGQKLLEGSVDPMVVYTAAEIVILEEVPQDEQP